MKKNLDQKDKLNDDVERVTYLSYSESKIDTEGGCNAAVASGT